MPLLLLVYLSRVCSQGLDMEVDMTNSDCIDYSELCHYKNPALWRVFCVASKRNPDSPSYFWTEDAVIEYLELKLKVLMQNERS